MQRSRSWWIAAAGAVVIVGCMSEGVVTPDTFVVPRRLAEVAPDSFMAQVGCERAGPRPGSGTVAVPYGGGRPIVFDCAGVPRDSVDAARLRYHEARSFDGVSSAAVTGYWMYDWFDAREWCYAEGSWGPDGLFYLKEGTEVWGCFWVVSYSRRWISFQDPEFDPNWGEGDGPGGEPVQWDEQPEPPDVVSLSVAPTSMVVEEGQLGGPFVVTAHYADNTTNEVPGDWSSSNSGVLVPDDVGHLLGTGIGQALYTAEFGGKATSATVTVVPEGALEYCPDTNPDCLKELEVHHRAKLFNAIAIMDTTKAMCKDAVDLFGVMMANGRIFGGAESIPDDEDDEHNAYFERRFTLPDSVLIVSRSHVHFDDDYLESSPLGGLAGLIVHEMLHLQGKTHPKNETYPYVTVPFSEQDSCVLP
jgi:hypothetical protein